MVKGASPIVSGTRQTFALGASPAIYQNLSNTRQQVVVSGGTVTVIELSRDGATFDVSGLIAGVYLLNVGDRIRVTYAVIPTVLAAYPI